MKNVNIYVDVDLTLVDHIGCILPEAIDGLRTLREAGCHLFLWSTGGAEYCRSVAERYEITDLFEAFLPKPDIFVDDMPHTIFNGFTFDVNQDGPWGQMASDIVRRHVDKPRRR